MTWIPALTFATNWNNIDNALLLETGEFILQETTGYILLEYNLNLWGVPINNNNPWTSPVVPSNAWS